MTNHLMRSDDACPLQKDNSTTPSMNTTIHPPREQSRGSAVCNHGLVCLVLGCKCVAKPDPCRSKRWIGDCGLAAKRERKAEEQGDKQARNVMAV